jgi:hypothetical protein
MTEVLTRDECDQLLKAISNVEVEPEDFRPAADTRFSFLFKALTPREFFFYFQNEYPQTLAFIVSFAPNRGYVKKVIAQVQDADAKRALTDYLYSSPRRSLSYNPGFVAAIEAEAQRMLNLQA